jgi:FtsZ-binding cell division protein ZapB
MECEYCKAKLSTKSALRYHQRSAKYCLKIQETQGNLNNVNQYNCDICGRNFTVKRNLVRHRESCVINTDSISTMAERLKTTLDSLNEYKRNEDMLKMEIDCLKKDNEQLRQDKKDIQERYDRLAQILAHRPTTKTTNTINNNLNLAIFDKTQADIERIVDEKYDKNYLLQGQKGVARFTHSHVLGQDSNEPPVYIVTDRSRCNAKYKLRDGQIVTDLAMTGLTEKVHPSVKRKATGIAMTENTFEDQDLFRAVQEVFRMSDDNAVFRRELCRLLETGTSALITPEMLRQRDAFTDESTLPTNESDNN